VAKTIEYHTLHLHAAKNAPKWKRFYERNRKKLEDMDPVVHRLHHKHMDAVDCIECARCCKHLGPRIDSRDIERFSKALRMKPSDVFDRYLRTDEDGDMVFKSMPCPFLGSDNYCLIYESRPKACREYPHTDRKRFHQIYKLSIKNAETCPVVFNVLEELTED
jgi:uncharacterized protein